MSSANEMADDLRVDGELIDRLNRVLFYILESLAYGYARGKVYDRNVGADTGQRHHKLRAM